LRRSVGQESGNLEVKTRSLSVKLAPHPGITPKIHSHARNHRGGGAIKELKFEFISVIILEQREFLCFPVLISEAVLFKEN
ncbi:MAG: hypothetical protein OXG10_07760, partial [Candidatus Dadabacteria bacterium]|nr:hypothetical protein [Candidatus Dadabacteria bacterium]